MCVRVCARRGLDVRVLGRAERSARAAAFAPSRRRSYFVCFWRPTPAPSPQVRKLSVKRIVSSIARDNLGAPVAGGLYDPALGPLEQAER